MIKNTAARTVFMLGLFAILLTRQPYAEPWSFGIMGDTQWKSNDSINQNFVAVGIIKQVNHEFIRHGVKLVIQVGDLANNYSPQAFLTRAEVARELFDAGIGYFPVRGNHESSSDAANFFTTAFPQTCGQVNTFGATNFTSPFLLLQCLSYSFDYNNVRFILIDQFSRKDNSGSTDDNLSDQIEWLSSVSAGKDKNDHIFVFAHKNLIGQSHDDVLFGKNPSSNTRVQNDFFQILRDNGVHYFFSGHDHLHHRSIVISPDRKNALEQVIAASNSYKFYKPSGIPNDERYNKELRELPISQELYTIGYYIVTIDGPHITVDYYASLNGCGGEWGRGKKCKLEQTPVLSFMKRERFGYSLNGREFVIAPDESFTVVADTSKVSDKRTCASIVFGANTITEKLFDGRKTVQKVTTGWRDGEGLISDIFILLGMANKLGSEESGTYALSLSYNKSVKGSVTLARKNGANGWSNAVDSNIGGTPKFVIGAPLPSYGLGTYGIDTVDTRVWAVINRDGEFAVITGSDVGG